MRFFASLFLTALLGSLAGAQSPDFPPPSPPQSNDSDLGDLPPSTSMTAETWLYLQEYRKQQDPKTLIFRRAQMRSQQRQQRLSSMAWFGYSNQRPVVNPMPFTTSSYSPYWSGNGYDPYRWAGVGATYYVLQVDRRGLAR